MFRNKGKRVLSMAAVLMLSLFFAAPAAAQSLIFNSNLNPKGPKGPGPDAAHVKRLRASGWKCPEPEKWPMWWGPRGSNVTLETFPTGGKQGAYCRISGKGGSIACPAYPLKEWLKWVKEEDHKKFGEDHLFGIWARGKGTLKVSFEAFGKSEDGKTVSVEGPPPFTVRVDSDKWVRYSHVIHHREDIIRIHPAVGAPEGTVDFDELTLWPAEPARALLVEELEKLYGTGALIENMQMVAADETFFAKAAEFASAIKSFRAKRHSIDERIYQSMEDMIEALSPYALTKGLTTVQVPYYNDMIALTRLLNRLAGQEVGEPSAITASEAVAAPISHRPGVRKIKQGAVMVVRIEPNKILYEEGEDASAKVTVKNNTGREQKVTLVALQYADLAGGREVARGNMSLPAGGEKTWTIRYNVGPQTYGRALEVQVLDAAGKELDRWQEYYQAGREWLRVQVFSSPSRYSNMGHYHASEPTDWGIQPTDAQEWISGQAGYHVNPANRRYQIKSAHSRGVKSTFYQNAGFCGIMGYEEMRKHPEYVLYDENGQFAGDPVYGGYPNPMELASPIEIGPKRKPEKPYLNRTYTPWQHAPANLARDDVVEYGAKCIRKYAREQGFDGVFLDAVLGVSKGYGYDGKPTVPDDKREIARMNARVRSIYERTLKEDNPDFGTWCNFSYPALDFFRSLGYISIFGCGIGDDDVSDEAIRAQTEWKNVSFLMEWQATLYRGDSPDRHPKDCLNLLCENRDYIVQKYGGNAVVGYLQGMPISIDKPGPSKWGWPAINYFMGQIIASQHRVIVAGSFPSFEPSFQFQTRYSGLLWAPDIKLVPEAEKAVTVKTPEELWWKRLVYRRDTKGGYDLIIHLLRIPPTEKWDLNWVDEPAPLKGVSISADIGTGHIRDVQACRPYYFEEEQQVVQKVLDAKVEDGKASVQVPPFRYYMMVVFRLADK